MLETANGKKAEETHKVLSFSISHFSKSAVILLPSFEYVSCVVPFCFGIGNAKGPGFLGCSLNVKLQADWVTHMRSIRLKKLQTEVRVGCDHAEHQEEACEGAAGPVVRIVRFKNM